MTAAIKGMEGIRRYMAQARAMLENRILRGAAKAGATVIADEAKVRSTSSEVAENIRVRVKVKDAHAVATIDIKPGWSRSLGIWQEYGTGPHYITVDDSQRGGRSAGRINRLAKKDGILVINGKPVGKTVHHPGVQPHPFLRPAFDLRKRDAI